MTNPNIPREIHLAPSPSAAGCMKKALGLEPGALLVNQDVLSCGPLPAVEPLVEWQRVRENYLRILNPDWLEFSLAEKDGLLANLPALGFLRAKGPCHTSHGHRPWFCIESHFEG